MHDLGIIIWGEPDSGETANSLFVCMYVAIRHPHVHHTARMRKAVRTYIMSCQCLITLYNAHQRNQPWPPIHSSNRSRSSMEGNRREIGKAKAEQGIRNAGGCLLFRR